ncbi:CPBP family intramembrane glutamic endopeptidase [Halobium salinum]|uniref:CPBP family intramembrane glutamic endopeptidase n=1 Tax=Halobium salinum TaxID=1364940 RepID=A0ABD5P822_9EURY|nr:CPBP family intramembrane glutamic endopeptidase [Halobium salinum]
MSPSEPHSSAGSGSVGTVERRRVGVFLLVAFGVAWLTALLIYATGGLTASPEVVAGTGLTLSAVLLPTAYMFAPAVGNVAARLFTGEGRSDLRLRPNLRGNLRTYALAWWGPAVLTVVGAGVYFLLFPGRFDPTLSTLAAALETAAGVAVDPWLVVAVQVGLALTLAPLLNALFAFGEEFGWRAYLLPKLRPLGTIRATLLVGVVWGVWHWPLIAMGYNYGFDYPGAPAVGMLAMCWFTVTAGTFLAWVTLRADSVWPAALGHGAINAVAAVGLLFVAGPPDLLLGPTALGLVGSLPWAVLAGWLLVRTSVFGE